jgi:hypothetical protein
MRRLLGLLLILAALTPCWAQTGGGYDLTWNTADCGGATGNTVAGGAFLLEGTTGQSDAGYVAGGSFELFGGFWGGGYPVLVSVPSPGPGLPAPLTFRVHPAYPNPFRSSLRLSVDLPEETPLRIEIYGARGERVCTLADEKVPGGRYTFSWDGRTSSGHFVGGGIYFLRVDAGARRVQQKIGYLR